ncbi:UNVERIFIED_ORG: DNA (cytosine-5)-methyltransferase 1 [Idiomarina abyssalis]|uniref:DNA cytosine methyltransferase n=1 Tax=Idiomarina sp. 017G TaxID=2183988 RepID=UPI000E0FD426|nr:DNA cytosine methyltransferase [Idiomarina sp. 017G]TDO46459.1 DNA (cytosine-5)-methyltransferase 1 [Idiomarina sp. 017G]
MKSDEVLVIDLFAGPGGLGEGISSVEASKGIYPFKTALSVEKENCAHKTLTTRAFFRKIRHKDSALNDYYDYVKGKITREDLFSLYHRESSAALQETLEGPKELGKDNTLIYSRIKDLVSAHKGPKVLIGGPPCQAYSLAGRSRNAGIKEYTAEKDKRHFLYMEYLKILAIAQPEVFLMENVKGILSAKINGKVMFPSILKDLRNPGKVVKDKTTKRYRIYSLVTEADNPLNPQYPKSSDFIINTEDFGVPQARQRVILLGVREDIKSIPSTLKKTDNSNLYIENILSDLPLVRSGLSRKLDSHEEWEKTVHRNAEKLENILLEAGYTKKQIGSLDLKPHSGLSRKNMLCSDLGVPKIPEPLSSWLVDMNLGAVLNHETRGHIETDLLRYAFCAAHAQLNNGASPKSKDFPASLAPDHANWKTGTYADRFRVQSANKCSTTITSHISKDGHYFIHYDPKQCRSLTVREAARLQTFPDNYFFEGSRTQQYVQVGNAVPPYLARQIGKIVLGLLYN